jgi:hypothetical protein
MNEYLAKLHRLELTSKGPGAKTPLVEEVTKLTKPGFVSFVTAQSRGISGPEPQVEGSKNACEGNRQNRQNPPCDPFPYSGDLNTLERRRPEYIEPDRWQQAVTDAQRFLAAWGDKALALGWSADELFGLHEPPARPHPSYSRLSRYEPTGLLWLLEGRRVIALTAETAAIECRSGNIVTYRKHRKSGLGPLGDSLDDFPISGEPRWR